MLRAEKHYFEQAKAFQSTPTATTAAQGKAS
jgi:hypothetical protein